MARPAEFVIKLFPGYLHLFHANLYPRPPHSYGGLRLFCFMTEEVKRDISSAPGVNNQLLLANSHLRKGFNA